MSQENVELHQRALTPSTGATLMRSWRWPTEHRAHPPESGAGGRLLPRPRWGSKLLEGLPHGLPRLRRGARRGARPRRRDSRARRLRGHGTGSDVPFEQPIWQVADGGARSACGGTASGARTMPSKPPGCGSSAPRRFLACWVRIRAARARPERDTVHRRGRRSATTLPTKEERVDPVHGEDRGFRPLLEYLLNQGR